MRSILLMFVFAASFNAVAQDRADLAKVTTDGLAEKQPVEYDAIGRALYIGDYIIPVTKDTKVSVKKGRSASTVEFSLQNGTAIKRKSDAGWRRASFVLEFSSKAAAKEFVRTFSEVSRN